MTKELKCPKCGGTHIVKDDCYDIINGEIYLAKDNCYDAIHGENNTIKELCCGHCDDCGTDIQWDVIYQFIGYDAIEES